MNKQELVQEIELIGCAPGVITCALVDGPTGMLYHASGGRADLDPLVEAARDYWQLHERNDRPYRLLGGLLGVVVVHEKAVINVMACAAGTVLVTLAERNKVNFSSWPARLRRLEAMLAREVL